MLDFYRDGLSWKSNSGDFVVIQAQGSNQTHCSDNSNNQQRIMIYFLNFMICFAREGVGEVAKKTNIRKRYCLYQKNR